MKNWWKLSFKWAASNEFGSYRICEHRRFRRACASAQSRQNLRCSLIQAVSQEEPSDRKPDPRPLWMAGHAQLKFVMTECSKRQIRLTGLKYPQLPSSVLKIAAIVLKIEQFGFTIRAPSSEFVSLSIQSWQILTAHAKTFKGVRDLAFCLKVPLDSLLVWAGSEGSGETARMRRLALTVAARIGFKYQIHLMQSIL